MDESESLRRAFNAVPELYHRARPRYPAAVYDDLLKVTELTRGARLLEVGCGTGIATLPLAQMGFEIVCVELGNDLADLARRNLSGYPNVSVESSRLEQWQTSQEFDLVYAATAWHWIDAKSRYALAARLLKPEGFLAFWSASHVFPAGGDPLFAELQEVYDEIGEGLPADAPWPRPGQLEESTSEIVESGYFEPIHVRHFDWQTSYDSESYIDLLKTFSGHINMQPWQQNRLFDAIRQRVNERESPVIRRHWGCVLHIARRK